MRNRERLAYLAGFLDGEGWVGLLEVKRGRYRRWLVRMEFCNTNPHPLEMARETFGGMIRLQKQHAQHHSPLFKLVIADRQAIRAATLLLPWLRVKREQAELILALAATRLDGPGRFQGLDPSVIEQREHIKARLTVLNRRGQQVAPAGPGMAKVSKA